MTLAKQLRTLEGESNTYRQRITELFEQHPDSQLFGSLFGLGDKLAPRLLSEAGDDRDRFEDPQGLQCYADMAPVSYQSGQINKTLFRRACNKYLCTSVHLWANLNRKQCPRAHAYVSVRPTFQLPTSLTANVPGVAP